MGDTLSNIKWENDELWEQLRDEFKIDLDKKWRKYWLKVFWHLGRTEVYRLVSEAREEESKGYNLTRVFIKIASSEYRRKLALAQLTSNINKQSGNYPSTS